MAACLAAPPRHPAHHQLQQCDYKECQADVSWDAGAVGGDEGEWGAKTGTPYFIQGPTISRSIVHCIAYYAVHASVHRHCSLLVGCLRGGRDLTECWMQTSAMAMSVKDWGAALSGRAKLYSYSETASVVSIRYHSCLDVCWIPHLLFGRGASSVTTNR